ncbi:MAG: FAD-dependent oxidoreductase [Pseudomonadota bacterium]
MKTNAAIPVAAMQPSHGLACRQAKDLEGSITLTADVVVVGSGAAGAVVAFELAASGRKVIILEAGPYVPSSEFREDLALAFEQLYEDKGGQANTRGDLNILQGACVGGSTVVNGCVCFRTPDFILADWQREHGLTELTPETLAPYFAKAERNLHVHENAPHEINANSQAVIRGCEKLGVSWKPLKRNIRDCGLTGFCLAGCASDRKQSMLVTYLPWALQHGAELYADTKVTRVLAENGEAKGVLAEVIDPLTRQKKADLRVDAKVVVMAAGAVHTPLVLQASGLCNGSGQLGRNFACHPSTGVMAKFPEPLHMWRGALLGVYVDEYLHPERGGFLLEVGGAGPAEISLFVDPGLGADYDRFMQEARHYSAMVTLIHDHNVGRVYLDDDGIKRIEYDLAATDFPAMKAAFKAAARIYFAAGAEQVFLPTVTRTVIERAEDIEAMVEAIPDEPHALRLVSYHPQGTARMGADPARSVVGPRGETHEVRRLFVADASLFPTSMIVNPQLSVYGLAGYIADQVRHRYGSYFA